MAGELNPSRRVIDALDAQLTALRNDGPDMDILLDLNFNFKTEGYMRVAEAGPHDLFWVEIDTMDPAALPCSRRGHPVANTEFVHRRGFKDFLHRQAMDIVDVPWNGIWSP